MGDKIRFVFEKTCPAVCRMSCRDREASGHWSHSSERVAAWLGWWHRGGGKGDRLGSADLTGAAGAMDCGRELGEALRMTPRLRS